MNTAIEKIVILGADHNGVALKSEVKSFLGDLGYCCIDIGSYGETAKVDYVDYAKILGTIIQNKEARWGVLICGTGVGMSMVANRFSNVRAALTHSVDVARRTREHNDANVLCLGSWVNSAEENLRITDAWFHEKFGEGRHVRRVEKTKEHDKEKLVFTNGVFDILHPGHIQFLAFSKSFGGKLIVGLNSDEAVRVFKGEGRPINNEGDRKAVLESLGLVDEVVVYNDISPEHIIRELHPHVVTKGGSWTETELRKRDNIPEHIEVKIFPTAAGYSTSKVVKKIKTLIE